MDFSSDVLSQPWCYFDEVVWSLVWSIMELIMWRTGQLRGYSRHGPLSGKHFYLPSTKLREGNVFTRVCLSVHRDVGSPCDHYPWCIGLYCTGPPGHQTWALPFPRTLDIRPPVLTSGGHWSTYGWAVRILLECFLVAEVLHDHHTFM